MRKPNNLMEWMWVMLEPHEMDLFLHHTKHDRDGRFILKKTQRARRKYKLSVRQLTKIVRRVEMYAQWYEIYILIHFEL